MALVSAVEGDTATAAYFIFAAAVFDFCDGFAARLLNARSPLGLQLDSLADVVSFGAAPSAVIYSLLLHRLPDGWPAFLPFGAFLIAVFSALRLAKFNVDERQSESFIGLPTPACALLICGLPFVQNRIDGEIFSENQETSFVFGFRGQISSSVPAFDFRRNLRGFVRNTRRQSRHSLVHFAVGGIFTILKSGV